MGFWVAMTMNGAAMACVTLSMVAWRSSMHSSRLACVLGEARLISSASTMLAKMGPGTELELGGLLIEDAHAGDVAGQQVGGELDAREAAVDGARQRLGEQRLADARVVLDDEVTAGQQRDDAGLDHLLLAEDDRGDVGRDARSRGARPRASPRPGRVRCACPSASALLLSPNASMTPTRTQVPPGRERPRALSREIPCRAGSTNTIPRRRPGRIVRPKAGRIVRGQLVCRTRSPVTLRASGSASDRRRGARRARRGARQTTRIDVTPSEETHHGNDGSQKAAVHRRGVGGPGERRDPARRQPGHGRDGRRGRGGDHGGRRPGRAVLAASLRRGVVRHAAEGAQRHAAQAGRRHGGRRRRARPAGVDRRRQADLGIVGRHPLHRRQPALLRRRGARARGHVRRRVRARLHEHHPARAAGGDGGHLPLELPPDDGHLEDRPRPGRGQHLDPQAGPHDAPHHPAPGRAGGRHPAAGRAQRRHRRRARGRRCAGASPRGEARVDHRRHRLGQGGRRGRRGHGEARAP